jgi:hypothetical protein
MPNAEGRTSGQGAAEWLPRIALGVSVLLIITGVRTVLFLIGAPVRFDRLQLIMRMCIELSVWLVLLVPVLWLSARKRIGPRSWHIAIPIHVALCRTHPAAPLRAVRGDRA